MDEKQMMKKKNADIAAVAMAIFGRSGTNDTPSYTPPFTIDSPGPKLRRAEELLKKAKSR